MSYKDPSPKRRSRLSTSVRLGVAAVAACFIAGPVLPNPVNPTVVNGTATFSQAGNVLTVTNSNGAIINWDKFSINAGETTHFAQTAASSTVLNRVLNDPTAIYGTLSSNGRVWLVNPAGIMVGPGGRIDAAGFVASTLNIRNEDFLAGRKLFENTPGAGSVINQGEIRTPAGGSVYLIGSSVSNEGIITTPGGETILAAGATVSLIDSATPGVKVDITGAEGNATNLGEITAEAGRIGIAGVIARNSGTLNASSVVSEGGRIFLKASQDAYVDRNGRIVTTGTKGGSVEVLGNNVTVTDNAEIDASGAKGGGRILIGGDYQGKNPGMQNASISYFGPAASLKADATEVGAGGTVIVWADDTTRAYGSISARGGALGGAGGFVETSGKHVLVDGIRLVDTRAPQGTTGTWLLDPEEMQVFAGSGSDLLGGGATWYDSSGLTQLLGGSGTSIVYGDNIGTYLLTTNVNLTTSFGGSGLGNGNITFNSGIYDFSASSNHLSLFAYGGGAYSGDIIFNNVQLTLGSGSVLNLVAGWNGSGINSSVPGKGSISLNNSSVTALAVTANAGGSISTAGPSSVKAALIDATAGGNIGLGSGSVLVGDSIGGTSLKAGGNIFVGGAIKSYGGDVVLGANSGVTIGSGGGINARRDGIGGTQTADSSDGGRILIDADNDRNSSGAFVMSGGAFVGTSNKSHLLGPDGNFGGAGAAIGIIASDVQIDPTATIKLNYDSSVAYGGGGDIGFLPTNSVGLGTFVGAGFTLDNTELSRIIMPSSGSANCGTGAEGCRIWIGSATAFNDPRVGALPQTNWNITTSEADFSRNASNIAPKRVHLSTTGQIDDAGVGAYAGYYGAKAGHLSVYGGFGIGMTADTDGLSFFASSVSLNSGGNIRATSVGGNGLALRRISAGGSATLDVLGGGVTLLNYFPGQMESTGGNFTLTAAGNISFAEYGGSYTVNGPYGSFTETAASTPAIRSGGTLTLQSDNGLISIVGDHAASGGMSVAAYGGISITDGGLATMGTMSLTSYGDIVLTGVNRGVIVKSNGDMSVNAANVRAYGGDTVNPIGTLAFYGSTAQQDLSNFGAGVTLATNGVQTITASGEILLQAGSANSNLGGGGFFNDGGSVRILSGGDQDISAGTVKVYAGASGHDNSAEIQATGNQSISIYGGVLDVRGGGDASTSVYGGQGSYNNAARIQHGQSYGGDVYTGSGDQTLTLYGGASVILQAGSGTGVLGYYGSDCYATGAGDLCRGSSNDAHIQNGIGAQTLNFITGGAIGITGGSAGRQNWAGISNHSSATTQLIFGNPDITLTGGSGGGTGVSYGGYAFQLSNDASINSDGAGAQTVYAGTITINGGSATYGGAGFGSDSGNGLFITTTGDLGMYGGGSSAGDPFAAAVYIGNKAGGPINLDVGGNLYVKAGSGSAGPVMIGSIDGPASVAIATGGNVSIIADGSHVGIGSDSASYGASVHIAAGGNLTVTDSATRGVRIGSLADSASATDVTLLAGGDVSIGSATGYGALVGVETPSGVSNVTIRAGEIGGGNLLLAASSRIKAGGQVALSAGQSVATNGNITQNSGGIIYGGDVGFNAEGSASFNGSVTAGTGAIQGAAGLADNGGYLVPSLYGGSLGFGAGSSILAAQNIELASGGDLTVDGAMTSTSGAIKLSAGAYMYSGYGYSTPTGGDVFIGGNLQAGGYVNISASVGYDSFAKGNVTQSSGSIIQGAGVGIEAGGSMTLAGSVNTSLGSINVAAGYQSGYFAYGISGRTPNGGNIVVSGTLAAQGGVHLAAESGYSSGANGNILQSAGSISTASGSINIEGGGNVTLNGSTSAYGGSGSIRSGFTNFGPTSYGGDIILGGDVYAANGLSLYAVSGGSGTIGNGHIVQSGGALASNGAIGLYADGNIGLQGRVETPGSLYIYAGLDNGFSLGYPYYQSAYGGDIGFGAGSVIHGGHVEIVANRGTASGSLGNIRQEAGGLLHVTSVGSLYAYAAGNVDLLGATIVDAGAPVSINAGYDYPGDNDQAFADKHVSISGLDADGSSVDIQATGKIIANTQDVGSIYANVFNSSSGGIEIANVGIAEPSFVDLNDGATANSTVTFTHSGSDLTLDSARSFSTYGGAGAINVSALSGNLNYLGGGALSGSSVILAADNALNIDGALSASGALGLAAGGILNVNNVVSADSIVLGAPTVNLLSGAAHAVNDAIAIGSAISIGAGTTRLTGANVLLRGATEGTGTLNLNGGVEATGGNLEFNLGGINAYGGSLYAPADIIGFVTGDILLGGGAYIHAGNDVWLTHRGATSLLSMTSGGHVLAGMPTTIHLDFPNRDTSGVVTDGSPGSGLFVVVNGVVTPATPGNGLDLKVRPVLTSVLTPTDPCVANPDLCKPPAPKDTPIQTALPAPELAKTDPTQPLLDPTTTTGGTKGSFGGDSGGTGTTGGTTGDQPSTETKPDEGTTTSSAKDEGSKDEKKDEKDKKSDAAKDEKKDEKPAQKKVAQCT